MLTQAIAAMIARRDYPEKAVEVLKNNLLLKYGVSACVPGEYDYSLKWDYPIVWAPLRYIAYAACKNYGYDGLTGKVANADYNAPKTMGWTAGVYMYFRAELNK